MPIPTCLARDLEKGILDINTIYGLFNLCALQAIAYMICTTNHFEIEAVLESFPGLNAQFPNN